MSECSSVPGLVRPPTTEWGVRFDWPGGRETFTGARDETHARFMAANPWRVFVGYLDHLATGPQMTLPLVRAVVVARPVYPWHTEEVVTEGEGWKRPDICGRRWDYMQNCSLPLGHEDRCQGNWLHQSVEGES